jgi:hypothetical protein
MMMMTTTTTTRPSSFSGFPALLLLLLAAAAWAPTPAQADLLTLLVNATNAPAGALDKAQADAYIFLQKFVSLEGSSYRAVAPGQEVYSVSTTTSTTSTTAVDNNDAVRRLLRGGESHQDEVVGGLRPDQGRHRKLFDCPNQCSNSGSYTCRLLGCAYCGRCDRLLLVEDEKEEDGEGHDGEEHGRRELVQSRQRQIEASLTSDLSVYCEGRPDCTIKAVIKRVHSDGSMTLAV